MQRANDRIKNTRPVIDFTSFCNYWVQPARLDLETHPQTTFNCSLRNSRMLVCFRYLVWQIKQKLGEHNLPDSFIKYYADMIVGHSVNASLIDTLTAAGFFMAALLAVYFNFIQKRMAKAN